MPESHDRVTILLNNGRQVRISWEARQNLVSLFEVGLHSGLDGDVAERFLGGLRAFEGAGATWPVELTQDQRMLLLDMLRTWTRNENREIDPDPKTMPVELSLLRDALADDLDDKMETADA